MYDDAQDALAAEYVLGTLSADEREHAEALLSLDPGFAASVRLWERRLGELNVMVEAVEPPPAVWDKIRTEVGLVAASSESAPAATEPAAPEPPVELSAAMPAETPPSIVADEPGADSIPIPPAIGQLPESVSDAVTASLAKSLAEPLAEPPAERSERVPPPVVEPKAERSAIERSAVERSANVVQLARRVSRWRKMTVVMGAIAALLALYIGLAQFAPGLVPLGSRSSSVTAQSQGPAQLGARLVAVLQQEPTAPAFLLTVDPQNRILIVRRVSATPEPNRSYELWLISSQFPNPRSLGVVGSDEFTQRPIPGNFDVATLRSASYAVSLEPSGGSPSGVPTGPVLFTGKIVESVPTGAPRT